MKDAFGICPALRELSIDRQRSFRFMRSTRSIAVEDACVRFRFKYVWIQIGCDVYAVHIYNLALFMLD